MKITILGCGYVGSEIAKFWHQAHHHLTVTTTTPYKKVEPLAQFADQVAIVNGSNFDALQKVIQGREVILLCMGAKNPNHYQEVYLETAKNVVAIVQNNSQVKQIIYTSSNAVLGDKKGAWTDETAEVTPNNGNGEILAKAEEVLLSIQSPQLKVCILRLAGIYGTNRELIKIFRSLAGNTRPGSGEYYVNWIHLDDIVNGIEFARAKELTGIYNLSCDENLQGREFFQKLFNAHNLPDVTWDESANYIRPYNSQLSNKKIKDAGLKLIYPKIVF